MIVNYYISKLKQQKTIRRLFFESSDSFSDVLLLKQTHRTNE